MARRVRLNPEVPDLEILRQIGGGSYGEIWMARTVTGALRAVKLVYREDFDDDRTFEREFEGILKYEPVARTHPGLVDILHVGRGKTAEGGEFYYYVMELGDDVERGSQILPADYEARNLRGDMLRAGKRPLPVGFCTTVGHLLAGALAHLHENGLAHRDVKPSNVIFRKGQACLADIGLVAARDQRTFVGTEGFVPPEGPGSADADVYALGKVLYEMATGKDRLEFPELPDEPIPPKEQKRWLALNKVLCDVCEPRIKKRKIRTARELEHVLGLLAQSKSVRPHRVPVGLVLLCGLVAGTLGGLAFWKVEPKLLASRDVRLPEQPRSCFVTILSEPENADVTDGSGTPLGTTPMAPIEYPIGMDLTFVLKREGYQSKTVSTRTTGREMVLPVMLMRLPPEDGIPWRDLLGQRYTPEPENAHVTRNLVNPRDLQLAPLKPEHQWLGVDVTENGESRRVAFADEATARVFTEWLAEQCAQTDGLSQERYRFLPQFSEAAEIEGVDEEIWQRGLRPFRVRVETVQQGQLYVDSEPQGAFVFADDFLVGTTPLQGLSLLPSKVKLRFERDGYLSEEAEVEIVEAQETRLPTVVLRESVGMPWQDEEWKNSLGMEFIRMNDELLASRWETRLGDYQEYARMSKTEMPERADFTQDHNHPVINITRKQAESFCEWLTAKERAEERIRETQRYRLPTNEEWTDLLGVNRKTDYPWGSDYPPQSKLANLSGEEAAMDRPLNRLIEHYDDGFTFTSPVGSFPPNALGFHDLGGNAREWTSEDYSESEEIIYGTARGGSWKDYTREHLRSLYRRPVDPQSMNDAQGFRMVLVKEPLMPEKKSETLSDNG